MVRQGKKATHKCSRVDGGLSGPSKLQGPVSEPDSVGCNGQRNSDSLHKQTRRNSEEMCALLWKIMTWCHHYQITLKARHIPGCLNVMADLKSRSNQVQSIEWSLHPQVFHQKVVHSSCRSVCHSSEPQTSSVRVSSTRPKCLGHRCSEHKLDGSHCLCLLFDGSPSQGDPKNQAKVIA